MLRIFHLARNVGSNLCRSTIREEQQKSRLIPPNQFLLWFNEIPGNFSPSPQPLVPRGFLSLEGVGGATSGGNTDRGVAPYREFSQHNNEDNQNFELRSLAYLRAVHYGALLAVGYTILHDKLLANIVRENSQSLETLLQASCPVLSIKLQKTVLAQPLGSTRLRNSNNEYQVTRNRSEKGEVKEDLTTSDYSSTKSDFETCPEFTKEEEELFQLEREIPDKVEELSAALSNIKKGNPEGITQLETMADSGCAIGLFYLGQVYEHGIIIKTNKTKARQLYEEAVSRGSAEAKYNLGLLYLHGESGQSRLEEGQRLVREAAREGVEEAKKSLGMSNSKPSEASNISSEDLEEMVRTGLVLETNVLNDTEDKFIALDLYRVASQQGHESAQIRMKNLAQSLQSVTATRC